MTPERRVELTGDVHLTALLERVRELEEAVETCVANIEDGGASMADVKWTLKDVLGKKGEA